MNRESEIALNGHAPLFAEARGDIAVSFEFFPPKTDAMAETLWRSIETLAPLKPRFVSVTYGAGGSTRERTHATVERIVKETDLTPAAHLTCVGATRDEIDAIARSYWDAGVRHIVALRGDPPEPGQAFEPHPGGYAQRRRTGRRPQGRSRRSKFRSPPIPRSIRIRDCAESRPRQSLAQDRRRRGPGDHPILLFGRLLLPLPRPGRRGGPDIEIVPGILPVTNVATARRFAGQCGAAIPDWLDRLFEGLDELPAARQLVAATIAGELCGQLYAGGVRHFHFYTLNRAELAYAICHLLGVRA